MLLKFKLTNEDFTILNPEAISTPVSIDYVKCQFTIASPEWEGVSAIAAVFKNVTYNKVFEVLLDSSNSCYLAFDMFKNGGTIQVKLVGDRYSAGGVRSTTHITKVVEFLVNQDIIVPTRTPSPYSVFIAELDKASAALEAALLDLKSKLENHELDGERGIGVSSVTFNDAGHIIIELDDGTQYTSPYSVRGEEGPEGPQGVQGIQGEQGDPGPKGEPGDISDVTIDGVSVVSDSVAELPTASNIGAGVMSVADKTKLDGIEENAELNVVTGITYSVGTGGSHQQIEYRVPSFTVDEHGNLVPSGYVSDTVDLVPFSVMDIINNAIIKSALKGMFKCTEHTLTTSLTLAKDAISNASYTVNKSGYTPIGVVGWRVIDGSGSGGSYAIPFGVTMTAASSGSATINAGIRAVGAVTNCTLYASILWVKNS